MATYRKRGRTWRAEIKRDGIRQSATFASKGQAVSWATTIEGEILAGKRGQIIPRTVKQALDRYAESESVKHRGERWERVRLAKLARELPFTGRLMADVGRADIAAWRDGMLEHLAPASARREYGLLRAVFAVALREWNWLARSPFDGVSPPPVGRPRTRRVSDAEIDALLTALRYARGTRPSSASQFIAAAVLLALETAMRQGELLSLDRTEIDAPGRVARLSLTKNGDERGVPLSQRALDVLALLPDAGPILPVAAGTFDVLFRRARKAAGLLDLHFHDLRREATTRLAARLDVLTLAKMTGHRDLKVLLDTYYRPSMSDVAAKLD